MQITLTELRRTPAPALDQVRAGHDVVVTEDGVPFMRMVPVGRNSKLEEMIRNGTARPPRSPRSIDEIRAHIEAAAAEKNG